MGDPKDRYIPYLLEDDITKLAEIDLVDFQSHTFEQHNKVKVAENKEIPYLITRLTVDERKESLVEYENRLRQDFLQSKFTLEQLTNKYVYALSYPFGVFNEDVINLLNETGYRLAFTIQPGVVNKNANPLVLPRINAGNPNITPEKLHATILKYAELNYIGGHYKKVDPMSLIYFNEKPVNLQGIKIYNENGYIYLPVRTFAELIQAQLTWNSETQEATIHKNKQIVKLTANSNYVWNNDEKIELPSPVRLKNGFTMVPLRFLVETFGLEIKWDGRMKVVNIYNTI